MSSESAMWADGTPKTNRRKWHSWTWLEATERPRESLGKPLEHHVSMGVPFEEAVTSVVTGHDQIYHVASRHD